jgi:hypothetical protein
MTFYNVLQWSQHFVLYMEIAAGTMKHLICLSSLPLLCCISHSLFVLSVPEQSHIRGSCGSDWRSSSGLWHHAGLYKFTMFLPLVSTLWMEGAGFLQTGKCVPTIMALTSQKPLWEVNYLCEPKLIVTKDIPYLLTVYELRQWLHTLYMKNYAWDHADDGDAVFEMCILIQEWDFDIQRTVHCDILIIREQVAQTCQIYFWIGTLHVSDSLSVHHRESSTKRTTRGICHTGYTDCLLAVWQLAATCVTYTCCCVFSARLLMMDRETVQNM